MKFLQKLGILSLVIIISLAVSGCMGNNNNSKDINTQALEYMEKKYGEKFEYSAPYGNSMTGDHDLLVRCNKFPGEDILVTVKNFTRDDKVFLDNYLAVKYKADTIDFIQKCADKVFKKSKVHYITKSALPAELTATATFDEFIKNKKVPLIFDIEVNERSFTSKKQAEQITDIIVAGGPDFFLKIVVVKDDKFGTFKDRDALEGNPNPIHFAVIDVKDGNTEIRWIDEK